MSASDATQEHEFQPPCVPGWLLLPRLRVQNANAISSPLTWGFPAISAFLGFMSGLERRLGPSAGIAFRAVGVVCHDFEAQVSSNGYTEAFHLTRNPVLADGSTAGIVEEGRAHLELSLVFGVLLNPSQVDEAARRVLSDAVAETAAGMRLAGGSILPPLPHSTRRAIKPSLELLGETDEAQSLQFRRLARRCLPGFALVSRDDLLQGRLAELQAHTPNSTALDAWLDLSRWNHQATETVNANGDTEVTWQANKRVGWTVPIPVGYAALSELHAAGTVVSARDGRTPFRFVETLWSMGEWVSPHRLRGLDDLLWFAQIEGDTQDIYRCRNEYRPPTAEPASGGASAAPDDAGLPASVN